MPASAQVSSRFNAARRGFVLAAALAAGACSKAAVQNTESAEPAQVVVQAARVDTLRSTILCNGTIAPAPLGDWTISAPQAGTVIDLPKNEGDSVSVGDLLVQFDIPGLTADLAARQADLAAATNRLTAAKATTARLTGLAERGIAARKDVVDAEQAESVAAEAVKHATAAHDVAAALGERAAVKARFAGIVAKRWHNVGDAVEGAATDPVLRVVDPTRAEIVATVEAADLGRVFVSRPAQVSNPTTGAMEAATVMTRPAAADSNSATTEVRLRFVAPTSIPIGTAVGVEIIADERPDALIIPAASVLRDGTDVFVMIAGADGKAHKRAISLGLVTRAFAQVTSGLTTGDQVIVRGHDGLADGAAIVIGR